jgi:exodeoxyribonuclease VII large subunit
MRAPTPSAAAEIVLRSRQEFERHIADYQRQLIHHTRYLLSERRHRVRDLQTHRGFRQMELLLRGRHQEVDELSSSLAVGLRLRLAAAQQRLTGAGARLSSSDLRGRATVLRRRIEQHRTALHTALERLMTQKRRRFSLAQVRFAALDLRARIGKRRRVCEQRSAEMCTHVDRLLVARRRRLESATLQLQERSPFQLLERGYAVVYDASGRVLRSADQVAIGSEIAVRLARGQVDATVRNKKKIG